MMCGMDDSGRIRVSDAEREAVVTQLSTATAEGRLTLEEFEERVGRAYGSRVQGELGSLLDDLPPAVHHPVTSLQVADPVNNVARVGMFVGFGAVLAGATAPPLAFFAGVAAIVLGVLGLRRAHEDPEAGGQVEAWAAIVTGAVGFVLMLVMIFVLDWLDT